VDSFDTLIGKLEWTVLGWEGTRGLRSSVLECGANLGPKVPRWKASNARSCVEFGYSTSKGGTPKVFEQEGI
jgi:hypothetical protein